MTLLILLFVFMIGLCWGSFLNVVACRILHDRSLFTIRSRCSSCNNVIAWYDNIPLISWVALSGECRACKGAISSLYPFIELVTGFVVTGLLYKFFGSLETLRDATLHVAPQGERGFTLLSQLQKNVSSVIENPLILRSEALRSISKEMGAYLIFFSSLIAATRTDLESMLIPQCFSLWVVPLGFAASYADIINIPLMESVAGALFGYFLLFIVAWFFKKTTGKDGLGEGDMELLALIGSFLGPAGVWFSLMIGSFSGVLIALVYLALTRQGRMTRIPFGPFLSLGALLCFFFEQMIVNFWLF